MYNRNEDLYLGTTFWNTLTATPWPPSWNIYNPQWWNPESSYSTVLIRWANAITVEKGCFQDAKYAIFFLGKEDPVIFCKNKKELKEELKKLKERKDIYPETIRVFKLYDTRHN